MEVKLKWKLILCVTWLSIQSRLPENRNIRVKPIISVHSTAKRISTEIRKDMLAGSSRVLQCRGNCAKQIKGDPLGVNNDDQTLSDFIECPACPFCGV